LPGLSRLANFFVDQAEGKDCEKGGARILEMEKVNAGREVLGRRRQEVARRDST